MNIITVRLNGMEYNLRAEENEEYLHMVAKYVDTKISNIMEKNDKLSRPDATILAALNLGDEVFKNKESYERINENYKNSLNQQKDLIADIEKLKSQISDMEKENESLNKKVEELQGNDTVKIKEITEEVNIMSDLIKAIKKENEDLKEENRKCQKAIKEVFSKNKNYRTENSEKSRRIKELVGELEEKNNELIKIKLTNNSLKKVK